MVHWRVDPDTIDWEIPFSEHEMPTDLPEQWAMAVQAVTHDLHHLRLGPPIVLDQLVWQLELNSSYWVSIGMYNAPANPVASTVSFLIGRGFALDSSPAQCTVWAAEAVQDELAGYNFIQWPSIGGP
ncbi:hypothetical protein ACPXCG_23845, partial [Gordonia sp. DT218]|uniref:hypothetical protein n=1 Tax=Gordonia sp. DT218 TaxID=3416659 RepID=UPI003CFAE155